MNIKAQKEEDVYNEILPILKKRGVKHLEMIKSIPFRKQNLRGDLSYSLLKNKKKNNLAHIIRVKSTSDAIKDVIDEIESYTKKFQVYILTDSGILYDPTKPIYQLKDADKQKTHVPKPTNIDQQNNFFSPRRGFLLKWMLLKSMGRIDNLLKFSHDSQVPQSTVMNFKKVGILSGHLKLNTQSDLVVANLQKTLEEWSFKTEKHTTYKVKHIFEEPPSKVIKMIANTKHNGKVVLGSAMSLELRSLYPVNQLEYSLYYEGYLFHDWLDQNQLMIAAEDDSNTFEVRYIEKPSRFLSLCTEPYMKIQKLDIVQCFLDLKHIQRENEIKGLLFDRIIKKLSDVNNL